MTRLTELVLHLTDEEHAAFAAEVERENREVDDGQAVTLEAWAIDWLRRTAGLDDRR